MNIHSVFLQSIEYFEGTMILTTNRVECIDRAFESRIHVSLSYPDLALDSRRKVWKNFIQNLHIDTSQISDAHIEKFSEVELNGRQIKNTVKMAGLLAATEEGSMRPEHVETMMRIVQANTRLGKNGAGSDTALESKNSPYNGNQ
jgi:AAA+ superfamily predicted ATPase